MRITGRRVDTPSTPRQLPESAATPSAPSSPLCHLPGASLFEEASRNLKSVQTHLTSILSDPGLVQTLLLRSEHLYNRMVQFSQQLAERIDRFGIEKKLFGFHLTQLEEQLSVKEEQLLASRFREQTLERKLQNIRLTNLHRSRSETGLSKGGRFGDQFLLASTVSYGDMLSDFLMSEFISEGHDLWKISQVSDRLKTKSTYMKTALERKCAAMNEVSEVFDRKLTNKSKALRVIRKRLARDRARYSSRQIREMEARKKLIEGEMGDLKKEKFDAVEVLKTELQILRRDYDRIVDDLKEKDRLIREMTRAVGVGGVDGGERGNESEGSTRETYPEGVVTLVFTDVESSTRLWEMDIDVMAEAVSVHNALMREELARWNGYEVKTEGDAFMIAFSDPFNALNFAVSVQLKLLVASWPKSLFRFPDASQVIDVRGNVIWRGLRVRISIDVGEAPKLIVKVDPVTHRADYFGPDVNRCARINSMTRGGEICMSSRVFDAISSELGKKRPRGRKSKILHACKVDMRGEYLLKGIREKERIYQVMPLELSRRNLGKEHDADDEKSNPRRVVEGAVIGDAESARAGSGTAERSSKDRLRRMSDGKLCERVVGTQIDLLKKIFDAMKRGERRVLTRVRPNLEGVRRRVSEIMSYFGYETSQVTDEIRSDIEKEIERLKSETAMIRVPSVMALSKLGQSKGSPDGLLKKPSIRGVRSSARGGQQIQTARRGRSTASPRAAATTLKSSASTTQVSKAGNSPGRTRLRNVRSKVDTRLGAQPGSPNAVAALNFGNRRSRQDSGSGDETPTRHRRSSRPNVEEGHQSPVAIGRLPPSYLTAEEEEYVIRAPSITDLGMALDGLHTPRSGSIPTGTRARQRQTRQGSNSRLPSVHTKPTGF